MLINTKTHLRKQIISIRNHLDDASRTEKNQKILLSLQNLSEIKRARNIFCYISKESEPDTHKLINWLVAQGKRVTIPKITKQREIIAVDFPGWSDLYTNQYNVLEPKSFINISTEVDISLTPGVCFDQNGNRLGYGYGYYDKWLYKYPDKYAISPSFDCQIVDSVPTSNFDKKVSLIVTETRIIRP